MKFTERDLQRLRSEGNVTIIGDYISQPPDPMVYVGTHGSGPELTFAISYLEERVEKGTSLGWAFEPIAIRMVGQTYTPDFVEFGADGVLRFYEVKGASKIPSQDRSSAKYRTTAALFESDMVQFFWAKHKKDGTFKPKKLPKQGKRDIHPFIKNAGGS